MKLITILSLTSIFFLIKANNIAKAKRLGRLLENFLKT